MVFYAGEGDGFASIFRYAFRTEERFTPRGSEKKGIRSFGESFTLIVQTDPPMKLNSMVL